MSETVRVFILLFYLANHSFMSSQFCFGYVECDFCICQTLIIWNMEII